MNTETFPAIYATEPHPKVSSKYQFIPSTDIIQIMSDAGFRVRFMKQVNSRSRNPAYAKHMICFREEGVKAVGDIVPEIIVTNSHDTSAGFVARGGLYRFICSNGLVVGSDLYRLSVTHTGEARVVVTNAVSKMVTEVFPKIDQKVKRWMDLQLNEVEKIRLAVKAIDLRHKASLPYYEPERLLEIRRLEDKGDSLWNVFNVVQENVMRGGVQAYNPFHRSITTKPVSAIDHTININVGLWAEADKLATELENA